MHYSGSSAITSANKDSTINCDAIAISKQLSRLYSTQKYSRTFSPANLEDLTVCSLCKPSCCIYSFSARGSNECRKDKTIPENLVMYLVQMKYFNSASSGYVASNQERQANTPKCTYTKVHRVHKENGGRQAQHEKRQHHMQKLKNKPAATDSAMKNQFLDIAKSTLRDTTLISYMFLSENSMRGPCNDCTHRRSERIDYCVGDKKKE